MSALTDVLHEAIATAVEPFVGTIGREIIETVMETAGAILGGSGEA